MPNSSSNTIVYTPISQVYDITQTTFSSTASGTNTLITTAGSNGSFITDILFRQSTGSTLTFELIICATGSQGSTNPIKQFQVAANAGSNGTTALAQLSTLVNEIFDYDLSGNRVLILESGQSCYFRTTATTTAVVTTTAKRRNF
jgi:hypothetical protein